jgi:hypothetical protein
VCYRLAHRTVRCARTVQVSTSHSQENEGVLRYNSPDYPVSQRSNGYLRATVNSDRSIVQRRSQRGTGTVWCGTGLSGATGGQSLQRSTCSEPYRLGDVAAHRTRNSACPVAHRTVRCAHRQQPPQRLWKWLGAINTPQPPYSYQSKNSKHLIQ